MGHVEEGEERRKRNEGGRRKGKEGRVGNESGERWEGRMRRSEGGNEEDEDGSTVTLVLRGWTWGRGRWKASLPPPPQHRKVF